MRTSLLCGSTVIALVLSNLTFAQSAPKTLHPWKMTCADFVALDDVYKPSVIYWLAGTTKSGIKETDQLVIDTAHPEVADVTEECKLHPTSKLRNRIRSLAAQGNLSIYKGH